METINMNKDELKKVIRVTIEDVLKERKELIEDAVVDAMEDIGLMRAMEEGKTGEYEDVAKFKKDLSTKINTLIKK